MLKETRCTPEQVIGKLREAEVEILKGRSAAVAAEKIGVAEQTFYKYWKEYGGLRTTKRSVSRLWKKKTPGESA